MSRFTIPFALTAVALVAACAHRADPAPAPIVVVPQQQPMVVAAPSAPMVYVQQPAALRAGIGRVETLSMVPSTAGAGGTTPPSSMHRLGIKMDDGTVQYVDSDVPNVGIGDRVQLTGDGYIRHPVP